MSLVLYETIANSIGKITLNDPENLNAMSEEMAGEFSALISRLKAESDLRALILTGSGRAFSAGGDLQMLFKKTKKSEEDNRRIMLEFYDSFLCMLSLHVPIVAAVNGHAIGAGLCLASACDVRVVGGKAKLGFTFTKLGLHPGMGATYFLPRIVGSDVALELMATGRVLEAESAYEVGLVSKLVETEKVVDEALVIAEEIASCGPLSVRQLVESLRGDKAALQAALDREADCQAVNYASAEFKEGLQAVIDKRRPEFKQ